MKEERKTIQQAAAIILREENKPIKAKVVAKRALEKGMVSTSAKDPIASMSQTLERNIRMDTGNMEPNRLKFVNTKEGRCIGLYEVDYSAYEHENVKNEKAKGKDDNVAQLVKIYLTKDILKKVRIYELSENHVNIEDAIISLIKIGLLSTSEDILEKLKSELEG